MLVYKGFVCVYKGCNPLIWKEWKNIIPKFSFLYFEFCSTWYQSIPFYFELNPKFFWIESLKSRFTMAENTSIVSHVTPFFFKIFKTILPSLSKLYLMKLIILYAHSLWRCGSELETNLVLLLALHPNHRQEIKH